MSGEDIKDVKNFIERLMSKVDGGSEEGRRIGEYLKYVVPDWRAMNETRLYSHIQHMLDKAEQIRRFEIELVWRRAIYFIPLVVIFFTAFGGVFYIIYDTNYTASGIEIKPTSRERVFLFFALFLIASANAFLSFCLTKMNAASHRWQENWEYHVEYLQTILGVNMIRAKLPKNTEPYTIRKTNILISVFICAIWVLTALICLFTLVAFLLFKSGVLGLLSSNLWLLIGEFLLLSGFLFGVVCCKKIWRDMLCLGSRFYKRVAGESFSKTNNTDIKVRMNVTALQAFCYKKEKSLPSCTCTCTKDQPEESCSCGALALNARVNLTDFFYNPILRPYRLP